MNVIEKGHSNTKDIGKADLERLQNYVALLLDFFYYPPAVLQNFYKTFSKLFFFKMHIGCMRQNVHKAQDRVNIQ